MRFASPLFLLLLLAVPVVVAAWVWLDRRRDRSAAAWASPALLPNMAARRRVGLTSVACIEADTSITSTTVAPSRVESNVASGRANPTRRNVRPSRKSASGT